MTLMPLNIKSGLFMNSTPYGQKARWADGNRVRWHNGAMRPVGGWDRLQDFSGVDIPVLTSDPTNETFRDGFSWVDNSNARRMVFGSNSGIQILQPDETLFDATPAGFAGSINQPSIGSGYGAWIYGRSYYGTFRPIDPTATGQIWRWDFDTYGEDLLAGAANPQWKGGLYIYDASAAPGAMTLVTGAPTDHNGFVVTDQRIVMTIGSQTEGRLVRWSDRENLNEWTPTELNWAGDFFLQGNGRLLSIDKVLNQILIVSESDAHVARYIGPPFVYGFDRVGDNCGPWNGACVHVTDRFAMWPGRRNFWMYDGTLRMIPCDIQDFITADISLVNIAKAFSVGVPQYSEIWWFYQSTGSTTGDVDSYVLFDYIENHWSKGRLERTCGVNGETYVNPHMVGDAATQAIYEHERRDILVSDVFAESGPMELGKGDKNLAVSYIYPDTETFGSVNYTLKGRQMPTDREVVDGPYPYANPVPTRLMAREVRLRIDGEAFTDWQVGPGTRLDIPSVRTGRR